MGPFRGNVRLSDAAGSGAQQPYTSSWPVVSGSGEGNLEWRRTHASRLFPVDVGLDPNALRNRYPDRRRYAITPAVVALFMRYDRTSEKAGAEVFGSVSEILCDQVTVPLKMQGLLAEFAHRPEASWSYIYSGERTSFKAPRYSAVIKYGKRYEPWVESVARIKAEK